MEDNEAFGGAMEMQGQESSAKVAVRKTPAGRGKSWFGDAFEIFKKSPWMWILLNVLVIVITVGFSQVPILGALVMGVIGTFMKMGLAMGAADVQHGKPLEFEHLFKAFRSENLGLVAVEFLGFFFFIAGLGMGLAAMMALTGSAGLSELFNTLSSASKGQSSPEQTREMGQVFLRYFLPFWTGATVAAVVSVLGVMATLFAPYLIVFRQMRVMESIKLSFEACTRNVLALTVYGLVAIFFALCTALTLGLGLVVLIPLYNIAIYCAYTEVFSGALAAPSDRASS